MDGDAPPARSAEQALQQASVGYDVVLIDSDPMPRSANTEYLARAVDATVIVVKAGTTTKQELRRAARLLERLQVAGIAVVLNKIQLERADRDLRRELRGLKQRRSKKYLSVTPAVKPTVPEKRTGTTA
jgi:Mrp family chromosome partitioning ATPase